MEMQFYKLNNGNIVTDADIRKAYEINTGTHLNPKDAYHKDYFERYVNYLYTVSLKCELEPSDENVKLIAKYSKTKAITMYRIVHDCNLKEAIDYVNNILEEE